jgi:hypothetical protein
MAGMFGLGSPWLMVPVTALVAALAGAVAGYAGYAVRAALGKRGGHRSRPEDHQRMNAFHKENPMTHSYRRSFMVLAVGLAAVLSAGAQAPSKPAAKPAAKAARRRAPASSASSNTGTSARSETG